MFEPQYFINFDWYERMIKFCEREMNGEEAEVPSFKLLLRHWFVRTEEYHKNISKINEYPGRDSIRAPAEYK
jgi:hypothetical protein